MRVAIRLEYKSKVYGSDYDEMTEESYKDLSDYMSKINSIDYLSFKNGNEEFYFNSNILKESIITLIKN